MSLVSFKKYKKKAENTVLTDTVVSGRYEFQVENEKRIIPDVINKLDLQPADNLLDIGCGPGTLLLPLSKLCKNVCGIDNEAAIERINKKSQSSKNIQTIIGSFLETDFSSIGLYTKILIYSVIHYLASDDELIQFLSKALKLLAPGGRMLIGDIQNSDKKLRYETSPFGLKQIEDWKLKVASNHSPDSDLSVDPNLINIDDDCYLKILKFVRDQGFESYLLPEPGDLPFGKTRDDILIVAHH
jgi:cyclopropane fatty-acyl-phospholipid synthase-like methyltransferase